MIFEFEPEEAALSIVKETDYAHIFEMSTDKYEIDNEIQKGFIIQHSKDYDLFYARSDKAKEYSTYLIERGSGKIVKTFPNLLKGGFYKDDIYYVEADKLKRMNISSKEDEVIENNIYTVIVQNDKIIKFHTNGWITLYSGDITRVMGQYRGLTTDAGFITDNWIYYYARKNEYFAGKMWLLNIDSKKEIRIRDKLPQLKLIHVRESESKH